MNPFESVPPAGELLIVIIAATLLAALATGAPDFGVPLVAVVAIGMGYSAYKELGT